MFDVGGLIIVGVIAVIVVALISWILSYYHRVPPSKAIVIFGSGKPRIITGSGAFVKPFVEDFKMLDLTIITIKTEKDEVYTQSGVPIQLDWVAQVQIDSEAVALQTAARAFLDKTRDEVRQVIEETLSANFRAIVGQMSVEGIHRDRDTFVQSVQDLASDDVTAMGVRIISMGIEEITDNEGYLEAMAAPQIAAVKRDAKIAEAEAEREARVKAASAKREADQAELDAQRETLAQQEALNLREVEVQRKVDGEQAEADQDTQRKRALAVEQQQEAEVLVPARARKQAIEIEAEAARRKIQLEAEAEALAVRERANADAEATEKRGLAEAAAYEAKQRAEAEGERARLLAEAEGRRELAAATAAEDSINLRQFIIEEVTKADVAKVEAIAMALAGLGNNVRVVSFGDGGNGGSGNSTFMNMLMEIPEVADMFRTKVEALSGEDFDQTMNRVVTMFNSLKSVDAADFSGNGSAVPQVNGNTIIPPEEPPADKA
ncbi:MAG: SPFH domain-containing protein [Chloroflexota bacterium]